MRSLIIAACAAAVLCAVGVSTVAAQKFQGHWFQDNNPGGWEVLELGDNSDGTYLLLRGTKGYCGRPGAPYERMRSVLDGTGGDPITWEIVDLCTDGYVRICLKNWRGDSACSTYWAEGWHLRRPQP